MARWESVARAVLSQFRAAAGRHPGDPRFTELVEALSEESPQFRDWWAEHPVRYFRPAVIAVRHPEAGLIQLEMFQLRLVDQPGLIMVAQVPASKTYLATAENYIKLLEAVFLVQRLPAWGTTLGARVARHPKMHIVDSGVMAWLLNLTPEKIAQSDPATLTDYGHLIETFAVGEILKQASWYDAPVTTGHFRTGEGDEVDLVLERDDGQVIAFEIKAGSRVHSEDLRGIRVLKERLGGRLESVIVLYTGVHAYTHNGSTTVLPLDRLWT